MEEEREEGKKGGLAQLTFDEVGHPPPASAPIRPKDQLIAREDLDMARLGSTIATVSFLIVYLRLTLSYKW